MKILKLFVFCSILGFIFPAFATESDVDNLKNVGLWCNPGSTWCVVFKADSSIPNQVSADMVADAKSGATPVYHGTSVLYFGGAQQDERWAEMWAIQSRKITWIQYQVTRVGGKPISNCFVNESAPIHAGLHTLIFSKNSDGYSCRKIS